MVLKNGIFVYKNITWLYTSHHKQKLKLIKDQKCKIIHALEKSIKEKNLCNFIGLRQKYFCYDIKITGRRRTYWYCGFQKIKTFCSLKDTVQGMQRYADKGKLFAHHTSNTVLLSITYKGFLKLINKKISNII